MMNLRIGPTAVDFVAAGQLAGRYVFGDDFKPHLHPLNTPAGYTLSLASPHDHKHHKGLMYALRTKDVNFWEEVATLPGEVPGRERHERFVSATESGPTVGVVEELAWLGDGGGPPIFWERRSLSCREAAGDRGYEWGWATELEAQQDVELVTSQWSARTADGALVNYHGLGIRFRRDFGCTGGNALVLDGTETPFADGLGRVPEEAEFRGSLDGSSPAVRAGVRIRQDRKNALFVLETPFAFMSFGPSNLGPFRMVAGQRLVERYVVTVFDLPAL
jgi:hypothetical protein